MSARPAAAQVILVPCREELGNAGVGSESAVFSVCVTCGGGTESARVPGACVRCSDSTHPAIPERSGVLPPSAASGASDRTTERGSRRTGSQRRSAEARSAR